MMPTVRKLDRYRVDWSYTGPNAERQSTVVFAPDGVVARNVVSALKRTPGVGVVVHSHERLK